MKSLTLSMLVLLLAVILNFESCKKADQNSDTNTRVKRDFFQNLSQSSSVAQRISDYIKNQNNSNEIMNLIISKGGYPVWEKTFTNKEVRIITSNQLSIESNADTLAIIPLVFNGEEEVHAFLKVVVNGGVDVLELYNGNDYVNYSNEKINSTNFSAEKYVLNMALLNYLVNGEKEYKTTNDSLFMKESDRTKDIGDAFVEIKDENLGTSNRELIDVTTTCIGFTYKNCGTPGWCSNHGGCDWRNGCSMCTGFVEVCWDTYGTGSGGGVTFTIPTNPTVSITGGGSTTSGNGGASSSGDVGIEPGNIPNQEEIEKINRIKVELDAILQTGDSYLFSKNINHTNTNFIFNSVSSFDDFLKDVKNNSTFNLELSNAPPSSDTKMPKARVNLIFIGGIDIYPTLKKNSVTNKWDLETVTSSEWGVSLAWSWSQVGFTQKTVGDKIIVDVKGYIKYNIFIEGVGTVYFSFKHYQLEINKVTGEITSIIQK